MHPSHRQPHLTPIDGPLYVVTAVENPEQYASRYRNYHAFAKHVEDSGAVLYTVEVVSGNRHFEVTQAGNPRHIQLRSKTDLWRKENLQNIGVSRLPHDWKYVKVQDCDFIDARPDWVQATLQALERYDAIQGFSTYSFMHSSHGVESINNGLVYSRKKLNNPCGPYHEGGAPGGEWAYTRHAWDTLGGMLQTPILGSADWYMSYALLGLDDTLKDVELQKCSKAYIDSVREWCSRASLLKQNVHYLENHALHLWHGPHTSRGYQWRWKILITYAFDPTTDLVIMPTGLLELAGNKPAMHEEIRDYIRFRHEDAI